MLNIVIGSVIVVILFKVFLYIKSLKKSSTDAQNTMLQESPDINDTIIGEIVTKRLANGGNVSKEIAIVKAVLGRDRAYAWSWYCNLVKSFVDEGGSKITAMRGAARFLSIFAEIDITRDPRYIEEMLRLKANRTIKEQLLADGIYPGLWIGNKVFYGHHGDIRTYLCKTVRGIDDDLECTVTIKDGSFTIEPTNKKS